MDPCRDGKACAQPGLASVGRIMRGDPAKTRSEVVPSERPTVLMVGEALAHENPGGLNRYLEDLASALEVRGTPVFTIRMGMGPTRSPSHVLAGKTSWPLPLRILSYWRAAARLADRIDVVDSHFALYGLLPVLATRLRSKPLVVHFHGPWAEESRVAGQRSGVILSVKRSMEAALYGRATQARHPLRGFQGHLGRALPRGSVSRGSDPPGRRPGPLPPRGQITNPTAPGALRRRLRSRGGTPS